MLSCRNLLIYLSSDLQGQLLSIFHYALKPDGILVLGPSETVTGFEELFEPVDQKRRIYGRKEVMTPQFKFPPGGGMRPLTQRDHEEWKSTQYGDADISRQVERYVLDQYAPPYVVVNSRFDVVFSRPVRAHFSALRRRAG
jgi:two-component system CheB/CheR fusion protein